LSRRVTEYRETPETREIVEREQAELKSRIFYNQIGHPEYGGTYAPIVVPEGSQVASIEEKTITAQGPLRDGEKAKTTTTLEVTLEKKTAIPVKSVSETILDTSKPTKEQVAVGVKTDPMFLFKEQQKTTAKEFVAGAVASVENTAYSGIKTAGLIADFYQAPAIVRGAIKTVAEFGPQPPPTVSSGLIGKGVGLVTGQDNKDWEKATERPAYAVGSVLGDILQSITLSETIKSIQGSQVKKIVGAKEIEHTEGTGRSLTRTRATEYLTETKTVSGSEAKKLSEFQRLTDPKRIVLAGDQVRIEKYGEGAKSLVSSQLEVFRKPNPILETISASKKQSIFKSALEKLHLTKSAGDDVVAVNTRIFSEKGTVFSSKNVGIVTKSGKSFVQSTDEIIAIGTKAGSHNLPPVLPKGIAVAKKTFTGVFVEGTIDSQAYLKLTKALPANYIDWYRQMGGISREIIQRTLPATVTVTTNVVGIQLASNVAGALGGVAGVVAPKISSALINPIVGSSKIYTSLIPLSILSSVVNDKQPERLSPFSGNLLSYDSGVAEKQVPFSILPSPSRSIIPKPSFNVPKFDIDQPIDQNLDPVISPKGSTYVDVGVDMKTSPKESVGEFSTETVVSGGGSFLPSLGSGHARFIPEVGASFSLRKGGSRRKRLKYAGRQQRMYPIKTAKQLLEGFA